MEAESAYFVRACKDLTENEKKEVLNSFRETLVKNSAQPFSTVRWQYVLGFTFCRRLHREG
jgi:hypothetical protein